MTDFPHAAEGERLLAEINRLRAELAETQLQRQTRLFAEYPAERCQKAEAEVGRLSAELVESRAMYAGAQADLNEAVGIIVGLRVQFAIEREQT